MCDWMYTLRECPYTFTIYIHSSVTTRAIHQDLLDTSDLVDTCLIFTLRWSLSYVHLVIIIKELSLSGPNDLLASLTTLWLTLLHQKLVVIIRSMFSYHHRRFLLGGVNGDVNISWVHWVNVCKPKKLWDLGVCDLRLVNLALLGK